jgi:indoleamine 2,3-dioxygenase
MALESESPPAPRRRSGIGHGLASSEAARNGLKGTGGTQLMPFLEQSRAETIGSTVRDVATPPTKAEGLRSWAATLPSQADFCHDIGERASPRKLG